jgi:hypothetical protein
VSGPRVTTNNVPRDIVDACELTPAERETFDYLDWPAIDEGRDSASFVRYKDELYDLGGFMRVEPGGELAAEGWHGAAADSFFSGLLIRFVNDDYDTLVVVGRYVS